MEVAQSVVSMLEKHGAVIQDTEKVLTVLTSNILIDIDRQEIYELLGLAAANEEVVRGVLSDGELKRNFDRLVRGAITSDEYRYILLPNNLEFADPMKSLDQLEGKEVESPSDDEIFGLGQDRIKQIVRDVLTDPRCGAGQGMFWNVLISERSPYVVKVERRMEEGSETEYQRQSLFRYPVVRDSVGKRFLPRQAALYSEDNGRLYVIQEKQDLKAMLPITTKNIDAFTRGEVGGEIMDSLKDESNKKELRDFIAGVEKLKDEHKLLIDPNGENVFFRVVDGQLMIKLVDYGCFELKWEDEAWQQKDEAWQQEVKKNREQTLAYIEKLKKLVEG